MSKWRQPVTISEYEAHRLVCFRSPSCWFVLVSRAGERPTLIEGLDRETTLAKARAVIVSSFTEDLNWLAPKDPEHGMVAGLPRDGGS